MIKRPPDILLKHLSLIASCPILLGTLLVFLTTNNLLTAIISFLASSLAVGIVFAPLTSRFFDMRELAIHLLVDHLQHAHSDSQCPICTRAKRVLKSRQDKIEIQLRLQREKQPE